MRLCTYISSIFLYVGALLTASCDFPAVYESNRAWFIQYNQGTGPLDTVYDELLSSAVNQQVYKLSENSKTEMISEYRVVTMVLCTSNPGFWSKGKI